MASPNPNPRAVHAPQKIGSGAEPWSQRIGALTTVPALIRNLGADPAPIMASAGLRADARRSLEPSAFRGGEGFSPSEVFRPHGAPVDAAPYRRFFRAPVRFNAEFCALRFPGSLMRLPIEDADAERRRIALAQARAGGHPTLVQAVYRTLRTLLLHGTSSGNDVARFLVMHRRTLNRRLSAEGTTFQQVLDEVRFAAAKDLLESTSASMHDIAAALGYAGLAPFMRAFRRWSGTSPGAWRSSMRAT